MTVFCQFFFPVTFTVHDFQPVSLNRRFTDFREKLPGELHEFRTDRSDTGRLILTDTLLGFPYLLSGFRTHFTGKYRSRVDMAVHIAPHLPPFFKDFSDGRGEFMRRDNPLC